MTKRLVLRTCNRCNRVSFGIKRKEARAQVKRFNIYFKTLTKKQQKEYYGGKPATMQDYTRCIYCGNAYTNFRPAKDGDCPDGCTINPILLEGKYREKETKD